MLLLDKLVEEVKQLFPDSLIYTVCRFLELILEESLKQVPRKEAINLILIKYVNLILKERASYLLNYMIKGVEKEAELVCSMTLVLARGYLAYSCHA